MDLASVDLALSTTRSVRRKLDLERPVEPELIEACIDVATQAPTGLDREAWRFLVITDPEQKAALGGIYARAFERLVEARGPEGPRPAQRTLAENLHRVPALILVCMKGRPLGDSNAMQVAFYGSVLPAAWSLMVALRARGVGATWTTLHLIHEEEAARALGIPEDVTQTVLLPVGHLAGARLRPAERKPAREVTYWNRWGERR